MPRVFNFERVAMAHPNFQPQHPAEMSSPSKDVALTGDHPAPPPSLAPAPSPSPTVAPETPPSSQPGADIAPVGEVFLTDPVFLDPLSGLDQGSYPEVEDLFRQYLLNTPRLDEHGELNLLVARSWLKKPTVSAICIGSFFDLIIILQNSWLRKLKAVDSALAKTYDDHIMKLQEIVEFAVQEFERLIELREKEQREAYRIEEEQKKAAAEAAQREKERLEEEKEALVRKMRELAEEDPSILKAAGFVVRRFILRRDHILTSEKTRTTYPAVASGTCEACAAKKITCTGIAGRSCSACYKLHAACSNSTGTLIVLNLTRSYPLILLSSPSHQTGTLDGRQDGISGDGRQISCSRA